MRSELVIPYAGCGGARPAVVHQVGAFLMLFWPLIFFAARGQFSFQYDGISSGGFSPGAVAVRHVSLIGEVLLPSTAYGCCLLLIRSRLLEILQVARQIRIFPALGILALLSTLWSQSPFRSMAFGGCYLIDTLFAFYLFVAFDEEQLLVLLDRLFLIVCLLCLAFICFLPQYGLSQTDLRNPSAWSGIFISRTGLARPLLYLSAASFWVLRRHFTRGRLLTLLLGLVMIFKAHVVTAGLLLVVYLVIVFIQTLNRRLGERTSLGFLVLVTFFMFLGGAFVYLLGPDLLVMLGRDPTLTGRTDIWKQLLPSIESRPLLGYGFSAFWLGLQGESGKIIQQMNWTFGYAHNGYIEICLQLGLVGLALFFASLVQAIRNAWTCLRYERTGLYEWFIGIIFITIVYNLDDCTVLWPRDLLSILYIVCCCRLSLAAAELRAQRVNQISQGAAFHGRHLSPAG